MSEGAYATIDPAAWRQAVKDTLSEPCPDDAPDALTVSQYVEVMGLSEAASRVQLHRLVTAGRAEKIIKTIRLVNGAVRRVSAFRLITPVPAPPPTKRKR